MKKTLIFAAASVAAILSAGCGHNIGSAFNGKFTNLGYDPEFNKFGLQYYNGVFVTGLNKENTQTNLVFEDTAETEDGHKTGSKMTYVHKTGAQVTGYAVDLEQARQGEK